MATRAAMPTFAMTATRIDWLDSSGLRPALRRASYGRFELQRVIRFGRRHCSSAPVGPDRMDRVAMTAIPANRIVLDAK
jgi:hypothetical protein